MEWQSVDAGLMSRVTTGEIRGDLVRGRRRRQTIVQGQMEPLSKVGATVYEHTTAPRGATTAIQGGLEEKVKRRAKSKEARNGADHVWLLGFGHIINEIPPHASRYTKETKKEKSYICLAAGLVLRRNCGGAI